jgi:transcription elongation factor Elf1
MYKTFKCPACGWVHVAVPLSVAEAQIREANRYLASEGLPPTAALEQYSKCFRCSASSVTFVPANKGDGPTGATIQAVVVPGAYP